jgi:hypothetical protein
MVVLACQAKLFQVVEAGDASGGLASHLDSRHQQSNEQADDSDADEQFDDRKAASPVARLQWAHSSTSRCW